MALAPGTIVSGTALGVGDPAVNFALLDPGGRWFHSHADALAGRPLVLAFARAADAPLIAACDRAAASIAAHDGAVAVVVAGPPPNAIADTTILSDPSGEVARAYCGDVPDLAIVVVDHDRRIAAVARDGPPAVLVAGALANVAALDAARPGTMLGAHPPVLVLPRVLDRADCDALIAAWHRPVALFRSDGFTNDGHRQSAGDFKVRVDSYGRTDQLVLRDPALIALVDDRFGRRVLPEMQKVFRASPAYREDLRVACYDAAEAGSLPAHRDDPTPRTRHRLFTVSVHLNAGDYSGGALRFREYGAQLYEVERGTAIVWSCALLHEVTAVTRGRRFILGTHMFDDLAAMQAGQRQGAG